MKNNLTFEFFAKPAHTNLAMLVDVIVLGCVWSQGGHAVEQATHRQPLLHWRRTARHREFRIQPSGIASSYRRVQP